MNHLFARGRFPVFRFLAEHPNAHFTVNRLARETRLPLATAWRAVRDLEAYGLATARYEPHATEVRLNDRSPAWRALYRMDAARPHFQAYRLFRQKMLAAFPRLDVRLFGSVLEGLEGPNSDVDILVIHGKSGYQKAKVQAATNRAVHEVADAAGISVVPLLCRSDDLAVRFGARKDLPGPSGRLRRHQAP